MESQTQIKLREWKEGENLESLAEGDIVRVVDHYIPGIVDYPVLYVGKKDSKFVFLSREIYSSIFPEEDKDRALLRLKISGRGKLIDSLRGHKYFQFDGDKEEEDYFDYIKEDNPEYLEINNVLEVARL